MNWILIALIAQFLFALVFILDKFFVSKTVLKPVVYAFWAGVLQILVLVFVPFGFKVISPLQILISLSSGALFVLANLLFYRAIQSKEISRIAPVVGGLIPIFTILLSFLFIGERLTAIQ
ncbi:EamA family transporter, partial [Patescibacteria group bacterium]|nr:EamA family transporter [Patescibacteria group bacterium]